MEASSTSKFVNKLRRWLSTSRCGQDTSGGKKQTPRSGPCLFLQLPREIRDMIYRELLLNTHPLIVHLRRAHRFEAGKEPYPAILRTKKQIHDEAAAIFYGENTWFSATAVDFFLWGDEIHEENQLVYVTEPDPINTYMSWIKHFVLLPDGPPSWFRDKVLKPGDVTSMLRRMGIQRQALKQLIIGVESQELRDEIVAANQGWLDEVNEEDMQSKFYWFTQRGSKPAFWLVSKE